MANIMLVDDDPASVARNTEVLETDGHSVTSFATSDEAARSVREHLPDLIILEAVLNGKLAGLDLARALAEEYPDLPLLMLTRADDLMSPEQLENQDRDNWIPVRRYLVKPVLADVLIDEINRLLPKAS